MGIALLGWFDGGGSLPPEWVTCGDADYAGGTVLGGAHRIVLEGDAQVVWATVQSIGGQNGWYFAHGLWWLRGVMDRLIGGPGLRRGRRHPTDLMVGDALDFWRVTGIEHDKYLKLRAEMKVPGVAILEFELQPQGGSTRLAQIARFQPRGLLGILYWFAVMPLHGYVFRSMLRGIREAAEAGVAESKNGEPREASATNSHR